MPRNRHHAAVDPLDPYSPTLPLTHLPGGRAVNDLLHHHAAVDTGVVRNELQGVGQRAPDDVGAHLSGRYGTAYGYLYDQCLVC